MGIYFVRSASRARRIKLLTNCRAPGREIGKPRFPRFAPKPDVFPPKRRSKLGMIIRGLSVENINDKTFELRSVIRDSAKGEANGSPDQDEAFRGSSSTLPVIPVRGSQPVGEAFSASGIERHASENIDSVVCRSHSTADDLRFS